jgi:hypothetical protein
MNLNNLDPVPFLLLISLSNYLLREYRTTAHEHHSFSNLTAVRRTAQEGVQVDKNKSHGPKLCLSCCVQSVCLLLASLFSRKYVYT